MGDEDAVESSLAAGVEIYLLKGAEAVVVDGEVDGDVGGRGETIVGEVVVGGWRRERRSRGREIKGRRVG